MKSQFRCSLFVVGIAAPVAVLACAIAYRHGQERAWDNLYYHRFSAWRALHGQLPSGKDLPMIAASALNPLSDLLSSFPLLIGSLRGALVNAIVQSSLFSLLAWAFVRSLKNKPISRNRWILGAVGAFVVLGAMASYHIVSGLGGWSGDILSSVGIMVALVGLCFKGDTPTLVDCRLLGCGLAIGLALKLTNAPSLVGVVVALLAGTGGTRATRQVFLSTAKWFMIVWVPTGGIWSLLMWIRFRSPVFPFFNSVFRSPLVTNERTAQARLQSPYSVDILSLPKWAVKTAFRQETHATAELPFQDPRLLIGLIAAIVLLLLGASTLVRGRKVNVGTRLAIFWLVSFVLWAKVFSVARYLVLLEVVAPLLFAILLANIWELMTAAKLRIVVVTTALIPVVSWVGFVAFQTLTGGFDLWHVSYKEAIYEVTGPAMRLAATHDNPILVNLAEPVGYVLPVLEQTQAHQIFNTGDQGFGLWPGFKSYLKEAVNKSGGLLMLVKPGDDVVKLATRSTERAWVLGECAALQSWNFPLRLCLLT